MEPMTLVLFIIGFILLTVGADVLVRGASELAENLGISRLIVGLTVVAFGTSAPELAVNIQSAWANQPDIAIGNVVGSNILNILLVLGVAALIAPLGVHKRLIQWEVPMMIGVSVLLLLLVLDGTLNRWEGLLLSCGIIFYIIFTIKTAREIDEPSDENENEKKDGKSGALHLITQLIFIIVGLGLLVLGSNWLVNGAVAIATYFGVSELIIGLTIISIGTSLPELATVIIGSLRGEQDLVVGNIIGSNLFNILLVLGVTSLITQGGLAVPHAAIVFDMPVMIVAALACFPIFFTDYLIERWEGALFLTYYAIYATYLFMNATQHSMLGAFSSVMLWFVIPLTVVTLIAFAWQDFKKVKD
ncbi:sodium:calcium antiporter [Candidatus Thiomargarita nelsonii]|uniref:Sodium:calcium antiporter n=1 Tax=Candidatus Thiomargarita nelsonii TaxID=1003181 RepID=A0A4E0QQP2_9GAMM|nr:sodium:calcium antiporter [Candidatus Thiomargarita nelsonii]